MEARTLSRIRWAPAPMPKHMTVIKPENHMNVPFILQMEENFWKMDVLILAGMREELIFAMHVTALTIPHMCMDVRPCRRGRWPR